jgi:hypothetical protein
MLVSEQACPSGPLSAAAGADEGTDALTDVALAAGEVVSLESVAFPGLYVSISPDVRPVHLTRTRPRVKTSSLSACVPSCLVARRTLL